MLVFCDSRAPETLPWGKVTLTDEVPPGYRAQQGAPRTRGPGQEPCPEGRSRSSLGPAMSHVTLMGADRCPVDTAVPYMGEMGEGQGETHMGCVSASQAATEHARHVWREVGESAGG